MQTVLDASSNNNDAEDVCSTQTRVRDNVDDDTASIAPQREQRTDNRHVVSPLTPLSPTPANIRWNPPDEVTQTPAPTPLDDEPGDTIELPFFFDDNAEDEQEALEDRNTAPPSQPSQLQHTPDNVSAVPPALFDKSNIVHYSPEEMTRIENLWHIVEQPIPLASDFYVDNANGMGSTSGFAFNRVNEISFDDLDLLVNYMYNTWCVGSMNPFERLLRIFRVGVCSDDGEAPLFDRDLSPAFELLIADKIVTRASHEQMATELFCNAKGRAAHMLNSSDILSLFTKSSLRMATLRDTYSRMDVQQNRPDFAKNYAIVTKYNQVLARMRDMRNLYILGAATTRESVSTIGSGEFIQAPDVIAMMDSMLSAERVTTQLVDDEYVSRMTSSLQLEVDAKPKANHILQMAFANPIDNLLNYEDWISEREQAEDLDAEAQMFQNAADDDGESCGGSQTRGGRGGRGGRGRGRKSFDTKKIRNNATTAGQRRQRVLYHYILSVLSHHGLQLRDADSRIVMAPKYTRCGVFTRCYEELKTPGVSNKSLTVDAVLYNIAKSNIVVNELMSLSPNTVQSLSCMLCSVGDPKFPTYLPNRCLLSFEDGILYVPTSRFYLYEELNKGTTVTDNMVTKHFSSNSTLLGTAAGWHKARKELMREMDEIMRSSSCSFIPQRFEQDYTFAAVRFMHKVQTDVADRMYPPERCSRQHPLPSSDDKVFHLYMDLVTDKFREWIQTDPTIYDGTFGLQTGLNGDPESDGFLREVGDPQRSTAARNLINAVEKAHKPQDDQQQQEAALPRQDEPENAVMGNNKCYQLMETLSHGTMQVDSILKTRSDVPNDANFPGHRLTIAVKDHFSAELNKMREAMVLMREKMDELVKEARRIRSQATTASGGNRNEEEERVEEERAETQHSYRILPDDEYAHTIHLTPQEEERFKTPLHHAFRAILFVYAIFGTYFVPRDTMLGLDIAIALWFYGISGSGKSRAMRIFEEVYGKEHIALINDNMEKEFGISPLLDPNFWVAVGNEVTSTGGLPIGVYLTWVSEGEQRQPVKNKPSQVFAATNKPMFGTNGIPPYRDQGATIKNPGNFTRRSLVVHFLEVLTRQLTDLEFDNIVRGQLGTILLRFLMIRSIVVPCISVQTFWQRASPVIDMWRLRVSSILRPYDQFVHELGFFQFGKHYIITDADLRHIYQKYAAAYKSSLQSSFVWDDLMTFIQSHDNMVKHQGEFRYTQFGRIHPATIKTSYLIGMRFTETATALLTNGDASLGDDYNTISREKHPLYREHENGNIHSGGGGGVQRQKRMYAASSQGSSSFHMPAPKRRMRVVRDSDDE